MFYQLIILILIKNLNILILLCPNSISSEILEASLPTVFDPPHLNLNQTIIKESCEDSFSSQIPPVPYPNALKSPCSATSPDTLQVTINNDVTPPKKRYDMMQDPVFLNSGLMPPNLQPSKTPSKMTNIPDDYILTHTEFKPNLPALCMTPTDYNFQIPLDRTTDHYVSYASRNSTQFQYWQEKKLKFFPPVQLLLNQLLLILVQTQTILLPPLSNASTIAHTKFSFNSKFLKFSSFKILNSLLPSHFWDTTISIIMPMLALYAILIFSNKHSSSCYTKI